MYGNNYNNNVMIQASKQNKTDAIRLFFSDDHSARKIKEVIYFSLV